MTDPLSIPLAHEPVLPPLRRTLTLPDGYETGLHLWQPDASDKLPVLFVHGIQSHPGWFTRSAEALCQAGHAVYQITRRGSGDNSIDRGHARSARQLLADVDAAAQFVLADSGAEQFHLMGVSWGGKLAAVFAGRNPSLPIASLTMIAPGLASQVAVPFSIKFAVGLNLIARPKHLLPIPLSEVELFTDNETMRQYLRDDPCRIHHATVRCLYASRCLDRMLKRLSSGCISIPTTLLLADRDRIIDNARTARITQRLTGDNATLHHYPAAHVLEFEAESGAFLAELKEAIGYRP
jgi:alpha-beta hydrolase superfamily lysophospholipase